MDTQTIRIPADYGITRYTVRRDRAERSWFKLEYYFNGWILDNIVEPAERKGEDVVRAINNPAAFSARALPFEIRVGGCWFNQDGNEHPMGFAKVLVNTVDYDHYEVYCFTGDNDPAACVIAYIFIAKA